MVVFLKDMHVIGNVANANSRLWERNEKWVIAPGYVAGFVWVYGTVVLCQPSPLGVMTGLSSTYLVIPSANTILMQGRVKHTLEAEFSQDDKMYAHFQHLIRNACHLRSRRHASSCGTALLCPQWRCCCLVGPFEWCTRRGWF